MLRFIFPIKSLRALRADTHGSASIEFIFVVPIMLALYFGVTELAMGITKDRQVSHAASVVADLTTQLDEVTRSDAADIFNAAVAILDIQPDEVGRLTVEINSFGVNPNNGIPERLGFARVGPGIKTGPSELSPDAIDRRVLNSESGAVVARINFDYTPSTFQFLDIFTMNETFTLRPRKSTAVLFDNGSGRYQCRAGANLNVNC